MDDQKHEKGEPGSQQLPPLAPRRSRTTSSTHESGRPSGSNRPRSSHRSRAGCWTCRGRKVKCDEVHPRCGQCTRLNKSCDWDQRWNFSDATQSTQSKFANVDTTGNLVWDPSALPRSFGSQESTSPRRDSLPSFADLTNDEDRERKAEGRRPGTYNVIVNPDSFSGMPEYSTIAEGRRMSIQSIQSSLGSASSEPGRAIVSGDPDTVVLTRFEDAVPTLPSFYISTIDRRPSLPGDMQRLDIASPTSPISPMTPRALTPPHRDSELIAHFEKNMSPRLVSCSPHLHRPGQEDPFVAESRRFLPLHHAICTLSLLSLHLKGRARQSDVLERMHLTTRLLAQGVRSSDDLSKDGVFFVHFILLIHDVCNPLDNDNLWFQHLRQMRQILSSRHNPPQPALDKAIMGVTLWIDIQAALAGKDSREGLLKAHMNGELISIFNRALDSGIPTDTVQCQQELEILSDVAMYCRKGIIMVARLAALSLQIQNEQNSPQSSQQALIARAHMIQQFQAEMYSVWANVHPRFLARDSPLAGRQLAPQARHLFDTGYFCFSICAIYSHSCVFPGQLLGNASARPEVALRCNNILALASSILSAGHSEPNPTVFATFLAGFAAPDADSKMHAIQVIRGFEGRGVGRNAAKTRELLVAVCEEQRKHVLAGGRAEQVCWKRVAREKSLEMIDFAI